MKYRLTPTCPARSSPSSSASSSSLPNPSPQFRSSTTSAGWAELVEAEDDTSFAQSSLSAPASPRSNAITSPPTSPDTSFDKVAGDLEDAETEAMPSSGTNRVLRPRSPPKTNLLSFFKPSATFNRPSQTSHLSDSDSDSSTAERKTKRKQQELVRPSKRLAQSSTTSAKDAKPKLEQLFLDPYETAGHSTLSCAVCNLSYARTPEDLALHEKHHKRVVGGCDWLAVDGKDVTILEDSVDWGTHGGGKVLMVDATTTGALGRKIKEILATIDTELSSTSLSTTQLADCKLFLFLTPGRKVIACAVVQRIESAFQVLPSTSSSSPPLPSSSPSSTNPRSLLRFGEPSSAVFCSFVQISRFPYACLADPSKTFRSELHPTLLGVQRIWTSSTHRRQGLASRLLDFAAKRFIYGCPVDRKTGVAFSQPTCAGMRLAREWTGTECFRVFVD
ncbi:N-acetyltransferase, partial [Phenoliferia sp. Uapishka_3]